MVDDLRDRLKRVHFGTLIGGLVSLYIAFYLIQTVHHNYQLKQEIDQLNGQISDVKTDKQALEYKIQYYQSDAYKEKEARAKLGLQLPGEGVVILPHENDQQKAAPAKAAPKKSNWSQWMDFLSGKGVE